MVCEWLCGKPTTCIAPWCYAVRCCHCWNIQVFNSWLWFLMSSKQAESCSPFKVMKQHSGFGSGYGWGLTFASREGWKLNQSSAYLHGTGGGQTWKSHKRLIHIFRHLGTSRNLLLILLFFPSCCHTVRGVSIMFTCAPVAAIALWVPSQGSAG